MSPLSSRSTRRQRRGVAILAGAPLVLAPVVAAVPAAAATDDSDVVINEVYARGGSANQPYTTKFIELHNPTGEAIDLDGRSLQYRAAGGTGATSSTLALDGEVPAQGYYLVAGGSNGSTGEPLPEPDATAPGMNLQGSNGTVALVEGTTAITLPIGDVVGDELIVDLVGYGSSNTWEGSGTAATSGGNSTPQSITRTDARDTDDNRADFSTTDQPSPQNSGSAGEPEPEPTDPPDPDPTDPPDPDPTDPPGAEALPIAEIQGTGDATPLDGQTVTTRGVVTGVYPEGGFDGAVIQTPGTGADLEGHEASHGIFVYGAGSDLATDVEVGDYLEVTGVAGEYFGLTQLTYEDHEVLEEDYDDVVPAQIDLPAVDEREAFESMLIAPQGEFTVTDTYHTNRFGWLGLAAGDEPLRQPTDVVRPGTGDYEALVAENADRSIRMDDGSSHDWTNFSFTDHQTPVAYLTPDNPVRVGAPVTFTDPVILDFRRTVAGEDSTWALQPQTRLTGANAADVQPITWENTRPAAPAEVGGDVSLATFNVLNYFTSLGEDEAGCGFYADREGNPTTARSCDVRGAYDEANLARQTEKIVTAITELDADVVALQEIENSISFAAGNTPADRDHALAGLVAALNAHAGDDVWAYVASAPDFPADEDVIRNAFIYQTEAVAPVGDTEILIGDDAYDNAREPMAQQFAPIDDGEVIDGADTFVVINNHFKSKGSGTGENADQGDGQGASNPDRIRQAQALTEFADDVAGAAGTELVYLVGDFNSYTMEDPMMVFDEAEYTNIGQTLTEKSTYSFGSQVGSLDHVLGSPAATAAVTGADIWNINAYESIAFEYSRYNYNVIDFHDDSAYRSSDHDPIVIGIDLVDEAGPATVDINLLGINDFHGRLFDYDTDEDGNVVGNDTLAFAGTIEELRAEEGQDNTIFLSAGDNIGASLFTSSIQEDRPTVDILNALEMAASAVGNHEFDAGFDNLTGQVSDWADFPHLGANVYGPDGEPALEEYHIETIDGVDVAVIGVVTEQTPSLVRPGGIEGLTFGNPVEAVNRVAAELTDSGGADVIVAAFHEGAPFGAGSSLEEQVANSSVFAQIVNDTSADVDAIFTGHTHQVYALDGPIPGAGDGQTRPIIQGESYGEYVSQVVLTVDVETGEVEDYRQRNVPGSDAPLDELVATYPRVAQVQEILDEALTVAEEEGSVVVGSVTADITTAHIDGDRDDRTSESTLGNLVANMLRDQLSEEHLGSAEIGVTNPGGLRAELYYQSRGDEADGEITFAEANAVLPFLNDLWTVTLSGEQFVTMLEQQWQPDGASNPFLHLGLSDNVSYTFDPDAGEGERITSVMIDGAPLDPQAEYRVGTFGFLAEGGDNFTVFNEALEQQYTGVIDREAWMEYIGENSPLSPDFARRSTVVTPLPEELTAGEEVSFEVSLLDLTSLGSPANTELAVYLVGEDGERGEAVHTAPVSDGAATVEFTVPEGLEGDHTLEMEAAPSGTTIQAPVTVAPGDDGPEEPEEPGWRDLLRGLIGLIGKLIKWLIGWP